MRHDDWSQLNDMVIAAVDAVLAPAGIPITYAGNVLHSAVGWADTISIISLGGDKLHGSVVLSIPSALLLESHPTRATSAEALADWLAELANLLLGQIKARLLARGVTIVMSTPITLSATALRFHRFKGQPLTHTFNARGGGDVHVMFEVVGEESAQLAAQVDDAVTLGCGEMMLF
jgi:CheY-specific phosphatase CheX